MKISAVQLQSVTGDIAANLAKHLEFVSVAVTQSADLVFFPELSLTGYEPQLAQSLATDISDRRLDRLQQCSDTHNIVIGAGLPITVESGVQIGMVWFTPQRPRRLYAKQQLHADEHPFFVAGEGQLLLATSAHQIAPAICYESLQPDHAEQAAKLGADVYLASVAKSDRGMKKAMQHYPAIAQQHHLLVIMADAIGPCDDFVSVGQSAVWNRQGQLLMQMDRASEGILTVDTVSGKASIQAFQTV